jgi:peptide/nickel transport system permease protein
MARFLVRRLILAALVLWIVVTIAFLLFFVTPHDVAQQIAGRQASPETIEAVRRRLGLGRPLLDQYTSYLERLLHGDLGYSFYNSEPVTHLLGSRVGATASLALGGVVLCLILGVAGGAIAASRPRSRADRAITAVALFFYSIPNFLLGVVFLYTLFYRLTLAGAAIFPPSGYTPILDDPLQWAWHLILPWLTIALTMAATYARLTRGSLLEELSEDHIRAARARGIGERALVFRHALRAGLTPSLTQFGVDLGGLLGGVVVIESIFGLPGLGQLALQAVRDGDLPVILGSVIMAAAFVVLANILVDLAYALLDKRVPLR